jgi:hypothetical protein
MAAEDFLRSHHFVFKKDSASRPASITTAISPAVHSAERGESGDIQSARGNSKLFAYIMSRCSNRIGSSAAGPIRLQLQRIPP